MVELIILAVSITVSAVIGFFVVSRDIRRLLNLVYGFLTLTFLVIAIANYMTIKPSAEVLTYMRIVVCATTVAVGLLYLLTQLLQTVNTSKAIHEKSIVLVLLASAIVAVLDVTPVVFSHLVAGAATPTPEPALGAALFIGHFVVVVGMCLAVLLRGARTTRGTKRSQHMYVLVGVVPILFFAPITSFMLPVLFHVTGFIILSPLYTTFFVIMVAYAIVKHQLFDIKFAAVRSAVYALTLLTLAGIYYAFAYVVSITVLKSQETTGVSISPANILLALGLAFMFQPIKRFFDKVTNDIFYRDSYSSSVFFTELSHLLTSTTDLRGLLERASAEIAATLKAEQAFFFLYYTNAVDHHMSAGTRGYARLPVHDAQLLDEYVTVMGGEIIVTDGLTDKDHALRRMLQSHKIALVMPLLQGDKIVGYTVLGEHLSGNYTKRDLSVLSTISNELVIAIQNALSLHEVKELNATLQQRIDVATKELRSSNAQLKHLDEVKDEFMSMASHQLRTPLTSVKGYISMVLEGDAGRITLQQQKLLVEAFKSSERMVGLISDFLNVSRLQTGKFIIEKAAFDMGEVVAQEVTDLQLIAKSHDIKLRLKAAHQPLPVMADESKFRQVIMNFIDNAIYYSHAKSTIIITVEKVAGEVALTVVDTGIGVPKEEQSHLFNKFFRARNARQQRPDGTGVGLYLARRVVAAHGGTIIFSSKEGKGSTFGFRLPLSALPAKKVAVPEPEPVVATVTK